MDALVVMGRRPGRGGRRPLESPDSPLAAIIITRDSDDVEADIARLSDGWCWSC